MFSYVALRFRIPLVTLGVTAGAELVLSSSRTLIKDIQALLASTGTLRAL